MNREDVDRTVAAVAGTPYQTTKHILNVFEDVVRDALEDGKPVQMKKFGKFQTIFRKPKKGRNPHTGEEIIIPSKRVVKFKAAFKIK